MGTVVDRDSFGYLGYEFQVRLITQLLTDKKFANSIIDIISPNYFDDEYLRLISATIKDANEKYESIPDIHTLEARLMDRISDEIKKQYIISTLRKIKEANLNDSPWVQDMGMKFCKQQELKRSLKEIQKIIDKGRLEEFNQCEEILRKALEIGNHKDDGIDVFDNVDDVLADDFRKPIPTGIQGLDEYMDGGLAKSELGVILAPFGVGKTTMITKIANTAKNLGYNVLQIFFEDNSKVIQRKHLACWTGIELNELSNFKEEIKERIKLEQSKGGILKLKKFPSDGTTIPHIKQYIRRLMAQGFKPDVILIDYIDCIQPTKHFDDVYSGEGNVMRQFESMLAELDIVGWTAVQGNRSSIGKELVEADQMGGSIKKGQIGHFIVSIAKTLTQKEEGTANMAILKSRFGKDGVIFNDIKFDNSKINIDMSENSGAKTFLAAKEEKVNQVKLNEQERVNKVMADLKAKKEQLQSSAMNN